MGILDRFRGQTPSGSDARGAAPSEEQALQRYRYLVRTAPPEAIEEAHREAFARLTPEQRAQVLRELSAAAPPNERIDDASRADPKTLARMATRAELRQPGTMERALGGGSGPGLGGMFASSLIGSIAGSVIGSAIAHQFLGGFSHSRENVSGYDAASSESEADDSDTEAADSETAADDLDTGGFGDDAGGDLGDF